MNKGLTTTIGEGSTQSTPFLEHHQSVRDIYNILTLAYDTLSKLQVGYGSNLEPNARRSG